MKFNVFTFYKALIVITFLFGISVLVYIFQDFLKINESEQNSIVIVSLILFAVFIYMPIMSFVNLKVLEKKGGIWSVYYPIKKRSLILSKASINKIEIIQNVRMKYVLEHTLIKVKLNSGERILLSSMQINNFNQLKAELVQDFKDLIEKSDFWKGKIK